MRFKHEIRVLKSVMGDSETVRSFWSRNAFGVTAHRKFREFVKGQCPDARAVRDTSIARIHYSSPDGMTVWELR
ncbi:MAG: hypothetical protein M1378_00175 [Bacteroidetes bacterium]|nr:hypothetical protein [Bacteroidota bacterium]